LVEKSVTLGWIEASIRYAGRFSIAEKKVYADIFGLSPATVARDQEAFVERFERHNGGMMFERNQSGRPRNGRLFLLPDAGIREDHLFKGRVPSLERWLEDTLKESGGYVDAGSLRKSPPIDVVRTIVDGIVSKTPVSISYHSRRSSGERLVSPHTIVHVAGRMHMRGYDHGINEPRDFVLSRISNIRPDHAPYIGREEDRDWNEKAFIVVEVDLDVVGDLEGVRMDFGLDDQGRKVHSFPKPLVDYMIDDVGEGYISPVTVSKLKK